MKPEIALPSALFDFVGRVARADSVDELQRRYLAGIGEFVASSAAGLYVLNPFTRGAEAIAAQGVSDFFLSRYEETGRHQDPVLDRALRALEPVHNGQLMSRERWQALPVYREVFGLHRMTQLLEAPLVVDETAVGTLNFGRTDAEGPFSEPQRVFVGAVARLLGVALDAVRRQHALQRDRDGVVGALELCSDALLVTDLDSAARRINAAGRRLVEQLADGQGSLDDLMVQPIRAGQVSRYESTVILGDGTTALLSARSVPSTDDPAVIVTFLDLLTDSGALPGAVVTSGLTRRERQVAELAATGLHDREIAAQLTLSPHTVKQYLKTVYGKVGVRSRVELTRMLVDRRSSNGFRG